MYLKSLTLKGFKSFAQPTTFAFEPGVTCIVGPNGSGKSNVVDALAWVMGEQGAKSLRGGKMEDVIFAGTSTRGPLGRAEVSLTIDNADGALPIEYSEVTISRTLFRNGASEYAINGEQCRLLDVQELLSDSGLGREMHVIVGQGQLDAVLRATPEERRGFIEEAAGILKHRRRKEKTLRKLDAMQANLTRLSDLAGEIRRQLKPLGRQAEVAREAATIQAVVRDARARLLADEVVGLKRALDEHGRSEQERHAQRLVLQAELEQHQAKVARLEQAHLGDGVDDARGTAFALEAAQEKLRALDQLARQRIALLGADSRESEAAPTVTRQGIEQATAELATLDEAIIEAQAALEASVAATALARAELDRVDEHVAAQAAAVSAYDLRVSKLAGQADAAAGRLAAVRGEVLRHRNALEASAARREQVAAELARIEAEADQAEAADTDLDEAYELAQARVFEAEGEIERIREGLHERERERDALAASIGALSLALDQRDGSAAVATSGVAGVRGLLAEQLHVEPGYEAAIAAALGSLADAVLVDDETAAFAALARAEGDDLGRVALAIAEPERDPAPTLEIEGLVAATAVVQAPRGVRALLADVLVADDLAAARAAAPALAALERPATVITRDGTVIGRYVVRGGTGRTQSRIELIAERDRASARRDEVAAQLERDRFELAEQREAHAHDKEQAKLALTALREYDAQLAQRTERLNRARVQAEAAESEAERLREALAKADERVAEAEQVGDAAKAELAAAREVERPVLDASVRDEALAAVERARETEVEHRLRLETARERVRAEQQRIQSMQRRFEAEQQAAADAARRAVIRRAQLAAATRVADALPALLASVDRSVAEARVALGRAEAERASRNGELVDVRKAEAAVRERLHSITEDVHGLELRIYEKKLHLSGLLERAESELGLAEGVLIAEYGPDQPVPDDPSAGAAGETAEAAASEASDASDASEASDASDATEALGGDPSLANAPERPASRPFDRETQQRRLAQAERKLAQLGRVNPLALEEFAALEQRHRFLTEQLTDLANTRRDLITIIEEIDQKMEGIFRAAFEDTREAFGEVFPILFPGGTGSISLTDPDDLLTTGIEVSVKPAGKKIERLSLLSGGERSLAAVALLLAIFTARPSPFYIMDEVEAALDDANLGRLLTTFEGLRESSQLIVITHQKRTMEIADALYGVSMRQDGVSAVVGQRVREEQSA
ncbi:chromosome segregation protein SMC [Agromyces sp. CFH 90414]|uniref:Chromosome partition protein Smc n=1 Tax=Agromyces agglutinans TaxID=2662258 RepID=A0A6I2F8M1_9MICO|nr:chromosome segregation protein SMC [Agromyces agglutinans]MRG58716.1 chromosome segregation protein SMC [Agromyces agglutinans]